MKTLILLFIGISTFTYAQNCNCETNFDWVKKTFEENDAGFQYIIDKKGTDSYKIHNDNFLKKIKNTKSDVECTQILYQWLKYFRSGHIAISRKGNQNSSVSNQTNKAIVETPKLESVKIDLNNFSKYVADLKIADIEGIWESEPYIIGVKKFKDSYKGFIIETSAENWKPKDLKFTLDLEKKKGIYYPKNKIPFDVTSFEMMGNNHFKIGQFIFTRKSQKYENEKAIDLYVKSTTTFTPFLEKLNSSTIYMRIPSFDVENRKAIDSILSVNKTLLLNTENLIIDLRNNGGGSDNSFREILPYLYTNPVRNVGVQFFSTELNNKYIYNIYQNAEKYGISAEGKAEYKEFYDKLSENLGKYVDMSDEIVGIKKYPTIFPNPKNIGIIINEGNASATEQFLLAAKQSKKVKTFGIPTMGALDVSNMNFVESPCKDFELGYTISKSFRIPKFAIDDIGIQPDYYLDSKIPEYRWIEYVNEVLNTK